MSASDWKPCPRCAKRAGMAFEKAKTNDNIPYEGVKMLEELKEAYSKGYPRNKDELNVDVNFEIIELIEKEIGVENLYPTEGKFRPVRVDKNIILDEDSVSLSYRAECRNCNYLWNVDNKFEGEQQ